MSKFKVGDTVRVVAPCPWKGKVGTVVDYNPITGTYNIESQNVGGRKCFSAFFESGLISANSTASTNAVVRNALAWRARNSSFDGKSVKTGKIHKDSPMRGFYQFISDDGIMALDASDDPREAKRIAEKAGFKVHS